MILLHAENASVWTGPTGNNTYLLPGRVPALIDAGVGNAHHLDEVSRHLGGRSLELLLITHDHVDHSSGVPHVVERWPSVRVRRRAADPDPLQDGELIDAGDRALRVIATPGHSPDHCCFFDEQSRDLFCGDLARAGGTVVIPPTHGGDLTEYLDSLQRVRALRPLRLLPGHGPIVEDPGALIDWYVEHRAERDAQILQALDTGARTVDSIAAAVYRALPDPLMRAARETVLAHLIKLEREGRVLRRGEAWDQAG